MENLTTLLDQEAGFDAEYAGGLSNHRSMALLALARLGASQAQLRRFDERYRGRLQPAPPPAHWDASEPWAKYLGQGPAWPLYRELFRQWLQHEYADDVLQQVLPRLLQGCGGAAFHGLIRTAYAVQSRHARELADALAYWACRWLDLGSSPGPGVLSDPEPLLRQLRALRSDAPLIWQRMEAAGAAAGFAATVARLRVGDSTLPRLATLAAQAYACSGNFTALHLVTSAHALRLLLPFVEEREPALQAYWRAFAAAVCVSGMRAGAAPAPRPWPELIAAALASDEAHLIKLVDSCWQEHQAHGHSGPWQQAATRAVQAAGPSP